MRLAALPPLLLLLVGGCDHVWVIRGSVTPAATVGLRCGSAKPLRTTAAGEDGVFELSGIGYAAVDCEVTVEKNGFATRIYAVRQVCIRWLDRRLCKQGELRAELDPARR